MENLYDFFGGPLHGQKKRISTSDFPYPAEGGTYRPSGTGHSVGGQPAVYIALFLPDRDAPEQEAEAPALKVGDPFPLDRAHVGDCPATKRDGAGLFFALCVLDEGHSPAPHVATDGRFVVEVWN